MYRQIRKFVALAFVGALFVGGGFGWYAYTHYTDPETVRRLALEAARVAFPDANVEISSASFRLFGGVRLSGIEVQTKDSDGAFQPVIKCARLHLQPDRDQLLRGALQFQRIVLDDLRIYLHRDVHGEWNVAKWIKEKPVVFKYGAEIQVRSGSVSIVDDIDAIPDQLIDDVAATVQTRPASTLHWEMTGAHDLLQRIKTAGHADLQSKTVRLTASSATQLSRRLANRLREIDETLFDVEIDGLEGELGLRLEADARQVDGGFEWRPSLAGSVRRGSIQTPRLPYPLRDVDARFALTADGIELSRLRFAFGQGWGELAARMPGWDVENAVIEGSVWSQSLNQQLYSMLPEKLQNTWDRFSPEGKADLHWKIKRRDGQWLSVGSVDLSELSILFEKFPYPVRKGSGRFVLHEDGRVTLDGHGLAGKREVWITGRIESLQPRSELEITLRGNRIPYDDRLRKAFSPMPPEVQNAVAKMHGEGESDVIAVFTRDAGNEKIDFNVQADVQFSRFQCDWFPYPLEQLHGKLSISEFKTDFIDFVGVHGDATVKISGTALKTTEGPHVEVLVQAEKVPADDDLRNALNPDWQAAWNHINPEGRIGIECLIVMQSGHPLDISLYIDPRQAAVTPACFPYRLYDLQGVIRFERGRISWSGLGDEPRLRMRHGNDVVVSCAGGYRSTDGWSVLTIQNLTCVRLPVDKTLLAALPETLRQAAEFLAPDQPIGVGLRELTVTWPDDQSTGPATQVDGVVQFFDCSLAPDVGIERVAGSLRITGDCTDERHVLRGKLNLDSIEVRGFRSTGVTARLQIDDEQINVQSIRGKFYDGWITGQLEAIVGDEPAYQCTLQITQASLSSYVNRSYGNAPAIDGVVDAGLLLTGSGDTIDVLNGAGSIRISNADIYRLPVIYDLVRFINLEAPNNRVFDDVVCDFKLRNNLMLISKLELTGPSLSLVNETPGGRMNLQTNEIAITMKTRWAKGRLHIPLLSNTLNTANDQLYMIQVRGQLHSPAIYVDMMPGVRRFFESGARIFERMGP